MSTLAEQIDAMTVEGDLYEQLPDGAVRCFACGHRCLIRPGKRGICKVRFNQDGVLRVPWGYVAALQCDPTEKKPFFHLFPGSETLTFGMLGCDFHCVYCQNWVTSQALRDPLSEAYGASARRVSPGELVNYASEWAPRSWPPPITSRSSPRNGRWRCSKRPRRPAFTAPSSPTATPRPKPWNTFGPISRPTRWISRRCRTRSIAVWAAF